MVIGPKKTSALKNPTAWLVESAHRSPFMDFAIAAVGLAAAGAISLGFFFGSYIAAIFGAVCVLVAMTILRLYADLKPTDGYVNIGIPATVFIWTCLVAFMITLGMGVVKLGFILFSTSTLIPSQSKNRQALPSPSSRVNELIAQMEGNYAQGRYANVETLADRVLKSEPANVLALNRKGSVAFHSQRYTDAIEHFAKALSHDPDNSVIQVNLAYALVDAGLYDRAIEILKPLSGQNAETRIALGRAYVYAGEYSDALKTVENIPSDVDDGDARVIEAAAIAGLLKHTALPQEREQLEKRLLKNLTEGIDLDPSYWRDRFQGKRDPRVSRTKEVELLWNFYSRP